jgi:hypothetical protein
MTKQLQQIVDGLLSDADFGILHSACSSGRDLGRVLNDMKQEARYRFMRGRNVPGARAETLRRWEAELDEALRFLEREVEERYARCRTRRNVALIEHPLLAIKIADRLRKKGIPYVFETRLDENVLTVHVVNEYFLEIPVTLESVDRIVGLVPYCLHRPDLAHEEVPGVRRIRDYRLARSWNERTSSGSE